jgi:spermidine synthase
MGTGSTAGSATLHPEVSNVAVVEIESAMVEGARHFRDHNHDVHSNEKVKIHITDGRLFLRLRPASFDVITSEPSNPWLAGPSDLFTAEFFELGARALREDGIFCQWVQIYGMSPENLKTIVRTFVSVFPNSLLLTAVPESDLLLVGFKGPLRLDISLAMERMQQPLIRDDLSDERLGINTFYDLAARFRMDSSDIQSFVQQGPLHTDDLPVIAYRAPRDMYLDTREQNMRELARFARGIGPGLRNIPGSAEQRRLFFETLAAAYRRFLPEGMEALICDRLAEQIP